MIATRVAHEIAGFGLLSLAPGDRAGGRLRHAPAMRVVLAGVVLGALAPVLIFYNLYVVHSYYLISSTRCCARSPPWGSSPWWHFGSGRARGLSV